MPNKLRHTTDPLKGSKKVPSPSTHPYMVVKPYGVPIYCQSLAAARSKITQELENDIYSWERSGFPELAENLRIILKTVPGVSAGGLVEGVYDPRTKTGNGSGLKYSARIVRRSTM